MCLKLYVELKLNQRLQVIPTVIQLYRCKNCDPYCVVLYRCFSIHLCLLADPANYRPISQTSTFCKLIKRVITAELSNANPEPPLHLGAINKNHMPVKYFYHLGLYHFTFTPNTLSVCCSFRRHDRSATDGWYIKALTWDRQPPEGISIGLAVLHGSPLYVNMQTPIPMPYYNAFQWGGEHKKNCHFPWGISTST